MSVPTPSMSVSAVVFDEYRNSMRNYLTTFELPEFARLNRDKCDGLFYLVFRDKQIRFGAIVGVKAGVAKLPYSAPFSALTGYRDDLKLSSYRNAVDAFVEYCRQKELSEIEITLPPLVYNPHGLSMQLMALQEAGFRIFRQDINFHFPLNTFDADYRNRLSSRARQKLKSAISKGMKLVACVDDDGRRKAYEVIRENRQAHGYPLHMTLTALRQTGAVVSIDYFLVSTPTCEAVAAAICYQVSADSVQVIYWGDLPDDETPGTMNYLAWALFAYYAERKFRFVDTGPASENGLSNPGLCDFKQSVGCVCTPKFGLKLNLS